MSELSQRNLTPMDSSTSSSRLTSSMRATLRSTVVPALSRDAHSRATPAFLLDFTSMAPDSVVPPLTRRWLGPDAPTLTSSESSALADAREHLEGQVLLALLDAVDGTLARLELGGELGLGEAAVLACVADERADPGQVVVAF